MSKKNGAGAAAPRAWCTIENLSKRRWAFMVFFGILILHGLGILVFTRGFLLTRTELSQYSHCSDVHQSSCFPPEHDSDQMVNRSDNGCWTKPAVDRVVIIVLDALRYDFVAPSTFFEEKKPWMDRLQVLHKLASRPGSSAKIFKAIADPPTTSLQRLKGLTTGGLPTFIDVGNSFGAPAIIEDNLIYQMAKNGKRVVMMGDDTWVQLFPHHFNISHPFPSFNVKDLDTVDNGCIEHLFPYLYKEDWDVLIAHFLGVDHAGHIFGVDSTEMIEKLDQYNGILEKIVDVLESQSGPGGLHENTLLLVMGDHGQTINGDHGGGAPEEVETSLFALSLQKHPSFLPSETDSSSCRLDMCLLCLAFPIHLEGAVIGRVNSELYALAAGTWNLDIFNPKSGLNLSRLEKWTQNYVNALCINTWQVKRYIDVYSASSVIGFSDKDLLHVSNLYAQANDIWLHTKEALLKCKSESCSTSLPQLTSSVEAYSNFLSSIAALARSKWTEFNLKMMGTGFCILVISLLFHVFTIKKLDKLCSCCLPCGGNFVISFEAIFGFAAVLIRAFSFLSNSFILEEGKVASFLLATAGILQLRYAIVKKMMLLEAFLFVLVVPLVRFGIELGQSKQAVNSLFLKSFPSWTVGIDQATNLWIYVADILPYLALLVLAYILYKSIRYKLCQGIFKYVVVGTIFASSLIALAWALDGNLFSQSTVVVDIKAYWVPRIIYIFGLLQLLLLAMSQLCGKEKTSGWEEGTVVKTIAMLSAWSSTIIVLSGKQGPLVALAAVIQGWCIIRLMTVEQRAKNDSTESSISYSSPVTKWSLLAVCLFFCTGHWCAFDGLRYAAAFVGFDEFNLVRQAILLTIDTFGFSHILPVMGLPLVVALQRPKVDAGKRKQLFFLQLLQVYLMYGLFMAISMTLTIICVTIQRRHLMVWGLFAPKFVFDAVGLLLTDFFICLASLYYFA